MKTYSIIQSSERAYYSNKKIIFLILAAIFVGALLFGMFSFPSQTSACHLCPPPPDSYCGDGNLDQGEECDDGNDVDGDGCSADCQTEEALCQEGEELVETYYDSKPTSAFIDNSINDVSGNLCDSTYLSVDTSNGLPHYIYMNWDDLDISDYEGVLSFDLLLNHKEDSTLIEVELKNDSGIWIDVCNPPESGSFSWDTCDLMPYLNTLEEVDDIELRLVAQKTGACHEYLKCAKLQVELYDCESTSFCGDGILDQGEECDEGQDNGVECDPEYGLSCNYCSSECTITELEGPYCGDGIVNGSEECEGDEDCCDQGICVDCACEALPPEPLTILAYKVVCESEEDLPNWAMAGTQIGEPSVISSITVIEYVENSEERCWLEPDWDFQWGLDGQAQKQAGDLVGSAPQGTGWNDFDTSTGNTDPAEVSIDDIGSVSKLWVRENLKINYIPFANPSGDLQDNVSAEMLCHDDILNFDNYDYINNPQLGNTYYCVAFNSLISEPPQPYCGDGNLDEGEQCEVGQECDCGYTCNMQTCLCEELPGCEDNDQDGYYAYDEDYCPEGDDCDDTNPNINPGAQEACRNQIDDDCDGYVDCDDSDCTNDPFCETPGPVCGNDILETGEECDDGQSNGVECDPEYGSSCNYCSLSCDIVEFQGGYCGDGIVNGSEDCEENGDCCPGMSCVECSCYAPITYFISGLKFNDKNSNGLKDNSVEPGLEEWVITIEGPYQFSSSTATDEEGRYNFPGLIPGSYTVCEELQLGWEQTFPTENNGCHIIEIIDGSISEVNFGNHQLPYCGDGNIDSGEECEVGQECDCGYICDLQTCLCEELPGPGCEDNDQDGYYVYDEGYCLEGDDCNDENPDINPGAAEVCDNQTDDDCDGNVDCDDSDCTGEPACQSPESVCGNNVLEAGEGCDDGNTEDGDGCSAECVIELPPQPECTPEDTRACDTGELGICSSGAQTCDQEGFWGECEQDNEPVAEICNNGLDDDCDGDTDCDDGNCEGDSYCGGGPQPPTCTPEDTRACGTGLLGICPSGIQTCNSQGFWGICMQNNQPTTEICNNGLDDDCDGSADCGDSDCMLTLSCYIAPPGPNCLDLDSDGYNAYAPYCLSGNDCDDSNSNINPGASEACNNSLDDDCDGDADCQDSDCTGDASCGSGGPVCTDSDGDDYYVEGGACGLVDCNDTNSNINPGATENCNNQIDDDCDGATDCDDLDCLFDTLCGGGGGPVCTDSDGDGYSVEGGDCGVIDCDDINSSVNPLAIELCNNQIDDDCDGATDCSDSDCAASSFCGLPGPTPECESGEQRFCDTGLIGICSVGTQTCNEESFWDECLADYTATFEICDNGLDDDCDGDTDCDDSTCSGVISCGGGGGEEEEEQGFVGNLIAQAGSAVSNLVASVADAISRLLGFFTNGKGLCLCLPPCFPWWIILILFIYSLVRTIRVWKKDNKEKRTWLVWTLVLLIVAILFFFGIFACLTFWLFIILVICTYLVHRSLKEKEEEEQTYKLFE